MKRLFSPVPVVGLILTAICCACHIFQLSLVQNVSTFVYDAFLRRMQVPPRSGAIAIVDLDDLSLQALGQWPWPRYMIAELADRIQDQHPAVVAFDVVFPEKDRTSPLTMRDDLKKYLDIDVTFQGLPEEYRDFDAIFAKTLQRGNVILGCGMDPSPNNEMVMETDPEVDPQYDGARIFTKGPPDVQVGAFLQQARNITVSLPSLREACFTASFNAFSDADNIVRRNPLIWAYGPNRIYPALALEALRVALGVKQCLVRFDDLGVISIGLRDLLIPCTRDGCLVVNYRSVKTDATSGFSSAFPTFSAVDVLSQSIPTNALAGKIVFVGTSAVGLRDIKATPISDLFSGVEVHATMVDNILAGDMLSRPNYAEGIELVGVLLCGLLLTVLISRGHALSSVLFAASAVLATIGAAYILMSRYHLIVLPTWMAFSILLIYTVLTALRYWQEERHKDRVRKMFGTMVSRDVLRYLENNPKSFSLTGARVEATVFFSDVAGFTSISEKMEPEQLSELLNRYLTPMTDIIMARGGFVDKYEGDAIMAEWGVPFAAKDHAVQACLAALEQQAKLSEIRPRLRAEFGQDIFVRMGINSGVVTAGNMGSESRFSYTVLGDVVNFAARCEPANKDYGSSIIVGEATWNLARHAVETRLLDRIVVMGKTVPVQIYELLGPKGSVSAATLDSACLYEEALHLHWQRRWAEAVDCLNRAIARTPSDTPSVRLRGRIARYTAAPPPEEWTGEFVRSSKD